MGGGFYNRSVFSASTASTAFSAEAAKAMSHGSFHSELDPRGKSLVCDSGTPIVVAMDVTGSMGDWSKIIYDKMPMLFGQLLMHEYCLDPVIAFAAIGDAVCDRAPLQVTDFARGVAIENGLKKLFLEAGGGGASYGPQESYDLAAAFFGSGAVSLPEGQKGFFFITGDENVYDPVRLPWILKWTPTAAREMLSEEFHKHPSADVVFKRLRNRFHVFHIKKPYDTSENVQILHAWQTLLGTSHVIEVEDSKSIVDLMLGIIALVSETRGLEQYLEDMQERGQTAQRQTEVRSLLQPLADELTSAEQPQDVAEPSARPSSRQSKRDQLPIKNTAKTTMFASLPRHEKVEVLSYIEVALAFGMINANVGDDRMIDFFAKLPEVEKSAALSLWLSTK